MVPSKPPRNTLAMIAVKWSKFALTSMQFDFTYRFGSVEILVVGSKSEELDPIAIKVALRFLVPIFRFHSRVSALRLVHFYSDLMPLSISNVSNVQIPNLRFR